MEGGGGGGAWAKGVGDPEISARPRGMKWLGRDSVLAANPHTYGFPSRPKAELEKFNTVERFKGPDKHHGSADTRIPTIIIQFWVF
jgi:hypothetical protein